MNIVERIFRYNAGRAPQLLRRKYAKIANDPFVFLRGTCHLFYQDWRGGRELDDAPRAWICGDLHLENLGCYKGDNRLAYFDLNDFDEAALAPCTWEIARFLVSLHLAAKSFDVTLRDARRLCRRFLDAYVRALLDGKPRWIERAIATGMIGELLAQVSERKRKVFLAERTRLDGKHRRFIIDGGRLLALDKPDRRKLLDWSEHFAARQTDAKFFRPLDLARRVAGTGSLGLPRYVVLVRGNGSPNANYILDLKGAGTSSIGKRLARSQPAWPNEAARIVAVQKRVQAISPAFLSAAKYAGGDYVLRELQPVEDRLDLASADGKIKPLAAAIQTMGQLAAWSALRGGGRQGAATADELSAFAAERAWQKSLIDYVEHYTPRVIADWNEFRKAWQDGAGKEGGKSIRK